MADYVADAQKAIQLIYGPQQQAIDFAKQMAMTNANADISALQNYGQTGGQAIDQAYTGFVNDLARNRADSADNFNTTLNRMASNYDSAAQTASQAQQAARSYIEQLAANSGGGSLATSTPTTWAPQEQAFLNMMNTNRQENQGYLNNLTSYGQAYDASRGTASTNAKGAQAFAHSAFQSQLGNLLAQAQQDKRSKELDYANQLMQLMGQGSQFGLQYATHEMDQDQAMAMEQAKLAAQAQIAQAQIDAENARASASLAASGKDNSWDREKFYAQLGFDKWKADQELAAQGMSGMAGANTYAAANKLPSGSVQLALDQYNKYAQDPDIQDSATAAMSNYSQTLNPMLQWNGWGSNAYSQGYAAGRPTNDQMANLLSIITGSYH